MSRDLTETLSGGAAGLPLKSGDFHAVRAAQTRVLHINSGNLYGGVESILVTLARLRNLCPALEPEYALCQEGRLSRELKDAGVAVHMLGKVRISRPWTIWGARRRLREVLDREHFDFVICHMPWSLTVFGPAVQSAGARLGFWAHAFHDGKGWLERLAGRTRPDLAIANSHYTESGLDNLFPRIARQVVYPPVALAPIPEQKETRARVRRELGADDRTAVIIQVSRIEACKGHRTHLRALARLKELPTPWVCWMVGGAQRPAEQKQLQELLEMAKEFGIQDRIQFLGQRSDVPDLLCAADIFCQPNETPDSFGITFVEALWAGRPVITAALGGALEIVDESCGLLMSPGDAKHLAACLRELIENRATRERLGQAGPARALQLCEPARQMSLLYRMSSDRNRTARTA